MVVLRILMTQHRFILAFVTMAFFASLLLISPSVYAATCNGVETSIDFQCDNSTDNITSILLYIVNFLGAGVGIAVVIGIIWGGLRYAASDSNTSEAQEGIAAIRNSIIGLVMFFFMWAAGNFFIPGGIFQTNAPIANVTGGGTDTIPPGESDGQQPTVKAGNITAATYNIRTTSLSRWDSARANSILSYIKTVDIVGIQEAKTSSDSSKNSLGWLRSKLSAVDYSNYATERGGEYRAIFWKNNKFTEVGKGSHSIDSNRNLVWVKLKHIESGTIFYFMTVHLDYVRCRDQYNANTTKDCPIRKNQAKNIVNYIASLTTSTTPIILAGDMNSQSGSDVYDVFINGGFKNAYNSASQKVSTNRNSIVDNFQGGTSGRLMENGKPIDHIYVNSSTPVIRVEITRHKGSDHVPVEADITLEMKQ